MHGVTWVDCECLDASQRDSRAQAGRVQLRGVLTVVARESIADRLRASRPGVKETDGMRGVPRVN